jgi:hypothetical protein
VLTFIGTGLDVVQNPILVVDDPQYLNVANVRVITTSYNQGLIDYNPLLYLF